MSILSIGVTGLNAAQLGLMTTQHNITNVSTDGFSRQRTIQATNIPVGTGSGFIGQGVNVSTIERQYNSFLVGQVNSAQTSVSELDTLYQQISQIDNMLADQSAGLSPALQEFFRGVQDVAANPSLLPSRQSMISSAEAMVSRFRSLDERLTNMYSGVNEQITSTVSSINTYSQQIAELNQRIVLARASGDQPPNDLLDQRDQLVAELNELIEVRTVTNTDGTFNVFFGRGQPLVLGNQVSTLVARPSSADLSRYTVAFQIGATVQEIPESIIDGGALSGLFRFRNEALEPAMNEMGRVAATIALTVNAQHSLGQDLLGQVTGDAAFEDELFTISAPRVVANTLNAGSGALSLNFISPPPSNGTNFFTNLSGHDYRLTFGAGSTFSITDLDTGTVVVPSTAVPATNVQFDGLTLDVSAAGAAGDTFLLQPTREVSRNMAMNSVIAGDPRLIAAALPVRTEAANTNSGSALVGNSAVAMGYSLANLPRTLTYSSAAGGTLSNFPNGTVSVTSAGVTTTYPITAPGDTVPYTSGATISFDGVSFSVSGTPVNGDQFTVSRNLSGTADSRNMLAIGKLQAQNTVAGGTATYQSAYARLVSDNGNLTREIKVTGEAQSALLKQAQDVRNALSGVNLDEEAANLIRYQQAFQASAKMIDIGSRLFDTILSIR